MDVVKITRVIDGISDVFGYIAKWLVLLACLVSAGNAVVRYLISYSSNGLLEIQWYMFGGIVLLGAAQTLRLNEHVRVDLLYSNVSDKTRLWIDIFGFTVFLLPVMALPRLPDMAVLRQFVRVEGNVHERGWLDPLACESFAADGIYPAVPAGTCRTCQAHRCTDRRIAYRHALRSAVAIISNTQDRTI